MSRRYAFGPFELDERERRLTQAGNLVHLQPKSFEVLLYLLEHAGRLVKKDEVLDAVWKETIVTENSLTVCIRQIRIALDDHPDDPDYIETIPTVGYRFMAEVETAGDEDVMALHQQVSSARQRKPSKRIRSAGVIALIAVFVVAFAYFAFQANIIDPDHAEQTGSASKQENAAGLSEQENSIAVLPFVNMSPDPDNEYFSDGLAEEILHLLARIPNLKVIGRTSSFAFKGRNEDLREIGKNLGVKNVLEGSVRKSGDRIRITAQLIDVSEGAHIWSNSYDRTMVDIFAVQDDVAASIVEALKLHVSIVPTHGRPTANSEAYSLFLKARALVNIHKGLEAAETLSQAISLDPEFAEAYELLAFSYWTETGVNLPVAEGLALSGEAAANALVIDPDLDFAQALYVLPAGGSDARLVALTHLERAWRENPFNRAPLRLLIYELQYAGYLAEAHRYALEYVRHRPISPIANYSLGETLYSIGRVEEAQAPLDFAYEQGEGFAHWFVPAMNLTLGNDELAIEQTVADLERYGITETAWVRDLVEGGRDPNRGQAYMDRVVEEILASIPDEDFTYWRGILDWDYMLMGFLDTYYEAIFAFGPTDQAQTDADIYVWGGTVFRRTGFTAHPRYLEVAEMLGITRIWEQRGPPDFCKILDGTWVCE